MIELSQLEEDLLSVVVGGTSKEVFEDEQLIEGNDGRRPQLDGTTLYECQTSDRVISSVKSSNGNQDTLTDEGIQSGAMSSPDSEVLPKIYTGHGHVQRLTSYAVSELSVPFHPSSSGYGHEYANIRQPLCSAVLTDATLTDFCRNDMQGADQNTYHWPSTGQVDSNSDGVFALRKTSFIHSCPNLQIRDNKHSKEDSSHIFASATDWSALDPNHSVVLEGIDENKVANLQRKPSICSTTSASNKSRITSDPCLTLLEPSVHVASQKHPDPAVLGDGSSVGHADRLIGTNTYLSHIPSGSPETNGKVVKNHSTDQNGLQSSDEYWNASSGRHISFTWSNRDSSASDPKLGQYEHIELSSLSPTQRKRKFRRKRSLSLPKLALNGKSKSGKTKKLCKKKTCNIQTHVRPVFRQAGSSIAISTHSVSASSSTTKRPGKHVEITLSPAHAKNQTCASLLCTGIHTSLKECITAGTPRIPIIVLSEPDAISSFRSAIFQENSNTNVCDLLTHDKHCLHIRRRSSVDKVSGRVLDGGEFTVVPVSNETNLLERSAAPSGPDNSGSLRVPLQSLDIDGEAGDTLTHNSITSLLSAKFRDVAKRWKQYGVDSPRFRKRLHSKWESMNYEEIDSQLQRAHNQETKSKKQHALNRLSSWVIYFFIGIGTAFMAAGVQISVEIIAQQKFGLIRDFLDKCSREDCLIQPVVIWVSLNAGITLLGAAMVTYVQPMAAGSGIPLIKSYLNGVRVPGLLSLRAFLAKCVGVVLSILGGLACGKEGPMAHSGGIIAAGLGKGRIPWFNKDINLYGLFRNDHNIRDLVAAGAASGVSAAFGAPVGGTLFSVEEAASFWNTELVWKVFFSAMIACFSTNVLLSAFEGHPTQLSNPGLVRFNTFPNLTFDLIEVPVFIFMAAIGGLIGSLFVVMNYKLTIFRQKYLHRKKWIKVVEAVLVAIVSAIVAFVLMLSVNDCTNAQPYTQHAITTKMGCSGDSHNSMSTLFLTTPEGCLKALLHDPIESYSVLSLVLFTVIFFLLGVWTYGLSVSSGVFIPSLAIGAAWGRLIGIGVVQLFPDQAKDIGKYALIGAASQLGGILRTTISLTVIIVECTGDITFGLCIMISLMISKWVGDFFTTVGRGPPGGCAMLGFICMMLTTAGITSIHISLARLLKTACFQGTIHGREIVVLVSILCLTQCPGLYDMNIEVSGIPLLSWEPPPLCEHVHVNDFMSQPVMTLLSVEKVGHIYDCLMGETFHGFPVIEQDFRRGHMYKGKLKGIILRHHILVLLEKRVFCPESQVPTNTVLNSDFENYVSVSQCLKIEDIQLSDADKECVMNLALYMNQTPYTVSLNFSMPRVFRLFRGLGLRHLVVVNDDFEPIGMVTRKDLAKYRADIKKGMLHMEHLTVENK